MLSVRAGLNYMTKADEDKNMREIRYAYATTADAMRVFSLGSEINPSGVSFSHYRKTLTCKKCLIACHGEELAGFLMFKYDFFGNGFIETVIVADKFRRRKVATTLIEKFTRACLSKRVYTSTNQSNRVMQNALYKCGFTACGIITALDENDPEIFYFIETTTENCL